MRTRVLVASLVALALAVIAGRANAVELRFGTLNLDGIRSPLTVNALEALVLDDKIDFWAIQGIPDAASFAQAFTHSGLALRRFTYVITEAPGAITQNAIVFRFERFDLAAVTNLHAVASDPPGEDDYDESWGKPRSDLPPALLVQFWNDEGSAVLVGSVDLGCCAIDGSLTGLHRATLLSRWVAENSAKVVLLGGVFGDEIPLSEAGYPGRSDVFEALSGQLTWPEPISIGPTVCGAERLAVRDLVLYRGAEVLNARSTIQKQHHSFCDGPRYGFPAHRWTTAILNVQ